MSLNESLTPELERFIAADASEKIERGWHQAEQGMLVDGEAAMRRVGERVESAIAARPKKRT